MLLATVRVAPTRKQTIFAFPTSAALCNGYVLLKKDFFALLMPVKPDQGEADRKAHIHQSSECIAPGQTQ